jgi:plasmid stability protein
VQVTLDDDASSLLATLAKKHGQSVPATAANLIRDALELYEDMLFLEMSNKRIAEDNGKRISHDDAWL